MESEGIYVKFRKYFGIIEKFEIFYKALKITTLLTRKKSYVKGKKYYNEDVTFLS